MQNASLSGLKHDKKKENKDFIIMKSASEMICFQEVPDEVSLSLSISNCPFRCEGCHSPWLREDCGKELEKVLPPLLEKYKNLISCVLFMGGDDSAQIDALEYWLKFCRRYGLKTALYSGHNNMKHLKKIEHLIDYIKIGEYNQFLGGLKSNTTNQRFYKNIEKGWEDITYKFWTSDIKK